MSLLTKSNDLTTLSDAELLAMTNDTLKLMQQDRQEWQLLYYRPNSPQHLKMHCSREHIIGAGGGNRSGKTDSALAEAVIQSTGVIPESLRGVWPREKFRGPISVRVVCESHTTTLAPVILYKLQYNNWSGVDAQGGERGHWGWIPKDCLIDGDWDRSWKEAKRQLKVLCRDPDNLDRVLGVSTWQFMSADQEPAKFASGEFHLVIMDEPPKYAIYRENRARIMSVAGRMILAMTWPDDPSIPVDWIFDEIYEPGQPGPNKDPDTLWIEYDTTKNPHIDQKSVSREAAAMSETERQSRIKGQPIRFANRIHPLFTDCDSWWCFTCHEEILRQPDGSCRKCLSDNNAMFNHVQDFVIDPRWPTIYVLDPHPRKPHMMDWIQVDGNDDYSVVASLHVPDTPDEMAKVCKELEERLKLDVRLRLMDPNMGASASGVRRDVNWQQEFADAGIACELASDSSVGRGRMNEYLRPDERTRRPRIRWHQEHCQLAIHQMKRYVWGDWRHQDNKDQKQVPQAKYDDHPNNYKYLLNALPLCRILKGGAPILRPRGQRKGGY